MQNTLQYKRGLPLRGRLVIQFRKAILIGGLAAGTLDIVYAVLANSFRDVPTLTVLQSVASGFLGRGAYSGGVAVALLGLTLHYLITLGMSLVFVILAQKYRVLHRRPILSGTVYGLFLCAFMNYVVLPLSMAYPGTAPKGWFMVLATTAHVVLVGIPIALSARRFALPDAASAVR